MNMLGYIIVYVYRATAELYGTVTESCLIGFSIITVYLYRGYKGILMLNVRALYYRLFLNFLGFYPHPKPLNPQSVTPYNILTTPTLDVDMLTLSP